MCGAVTVSQGTVRLDSPTQVTEGSEGAAVGVSSRNDPRADSKESTEVRGQRSQGGPGLGGLTQ